MAKASSTRKRGSTREDRGDVVAVAIPTFSQGMEIWRGIQEVFLTAGGPVKLAHPNYDSNLAERLDAIPNLAGLIIFAADDKLETSISNLKVPCINVSGRLPKSRFHRVRVDERETGRCAARYLLDAGYEEAVAYISAQEAEFDRKRLQAFTTELAAQAPQIPVTIRDPQNSRALAALKKAQRPTLVLASLFNVAVGILDWVDAHSAEIKTDIGLLCLDDPHGSVAWRPGVEISAVKLPWKQVGMQAARTMLDRIGSGTAMPRDQLIAGHEVIVRASTRNQSVLPPIVKSVNNWLESAYNPRMGVEEIADTLGFSVSGIYKNFRSAFGHSLGDELARRRHLHARRLLANSHLPVKAIADLCGYNSPSAFIQAFKKREGTTPSIWRQRA
jgi:DNA-binding LacI/PurR family transcriptional regulator